MVAKIQSSFSKLEAGQEAYNTKNWQVVPSTNQVTPGPRSGKNGYKPARGRRPEQPKILKRTTDEPQHQNFPKKWIVWSCKQKA